MYFRPNAIFKGEFSYLFIEPVYESRNVPGISLGARATTMKWIWDEENRQSP